MIRRTLLLVAVLSLALPASALADMAGVTRSKLPNGLTVIVRENAAAPIVAYSLLVKMGTRNETPDNAGISNMLQLMLVRGTEKMTGEQIAATADRLGAASMPTATTTIRRTRYAPRATGSRC
jgi:zinc protease